MDTIFIRDLTLRGKHGVSDEERSAPQEFIVDIVIDFDTKKSAASDNLADTLDYGPFRKIAKDVVENSSFKLLEKLADVIAGKILEAAPIGRVSVTVRKTEMYTDCMPGVSVTRVRD